MSESVVEVPLRMPLALPRWTSTGRRVRPSEVGLVTMNGDDSQQRWRQLQYCSGYCDYMFQLHLADCDGLRHRSKLSQLRPVMPPQLEVRKRWKRSAECHAYMEAHGFHLP